MKKNLPNPDAVPSRNPDTDAYLMAHIAEVPGFQDRPKEVKSD
jgi:hypothetical protein